VRGGVKPRVGLAGAGRVKDPATAGRATAAFATQKAGTLKGKGKAAAVVVGGAPVAGAALAIAADEAKPEAAARREDERMVLVDDTQAISIEISQEELHDEPEEHHEEHVGVFVSDVGSHEEGGSIPAGSPIEREEEVISPPPGSGSEHEHEHEYQHPIEEEHGSPQLSEEQQEELLKDDMPALPEPSKKEVADAAIHPGASEHLEKVVSPYHPPSLPPGEQVDEEKWENVEIPGDV
jgi:hypothetical protein